MMSGFSLQMPMDGGRGITFQPLPLCTVTVVVFFGSIFFTTIAMATKAWLHGDIRAMRATQMASHSACEQYSHPVRDFSSKSNRKLKSHIPALELNFTSIFVLFYNLSKIGCIMFVVYMLEYYPVFADSQQLDCDIDLFVFLIMVCVLIGVFSIRPNTLNFEHLETLREEDPKDEKKQTSIPPKESLMNGSETKRNEFSTPTRRRVLVNDSMSESDEISSILSDMDSYSLDRSSDRKAKKTDDDSHSLEVTLNDSDDDSSSPKPSAPIDADSILEDILLYEEKKDQKAPESLDLGALSDLPVFASNPDIDILNIHQNLELKGFMTICFLFYQFTNAITYEVLKNDKMDDESKESENSIVDDINEEGTNYYYNMSRIFITLFLFLTGFGHTMYCYRKNDYSLNRLAKVLFRMNLSGMFLCMTLGKPYIFYQACWLHSYFFIIIFLGMKWRNATNYTKYGLRIKLTLLAFVVFLMWDCDIGLWSIHLILFGSSKQPIDGAPYGQLWEFYFRGFMHHWVPFIGMLFALNHPVTSLLMRRLEVIGHSSEVWFKAITGLLLSAVTAIWALGPFNSSKFMYNATNPYFGALPVLCYFYFRNINRTVRSYHVAAYKAIGIYSLEIYLLHIHLFVGEDKTTKTLIPGYPTCNLLCIIWLTVMIAKSLRTATTVVTTMITASNDKGRRRCERHLLIMFGTLAIIHALSTILEFMRLITPEVVVTSTIVGGILLYQTVIDSVWNDKSLKAANVSDLSTVNSLRNTDNNATSSVSKTSPPIVGTVFILFFCLVWQVISMNGNQTMRSLATTCLDNANTGSWVPLDSCSEFQKGRNAREHHSRSANTICIENHQWGWTNSAVASKCKFHFHSHVEAQRKMNQKTIAFVGDSMTRNLFFAVCRTFGDTSAGTPEQDLPKHSDITKVFGSVTLIFQWAPFASDVLAKINFTRGQVNLIVAGSGVMDKLHVYATDEDKQSYVQSLERLARGLQLLKSNNVPVVWFTPTVVNTKALPTEEKRTHMSESSIEEIRDLYKQSGVNDAAMFVLEGQTFTKDQVHQSFDGVQYPPSIYDVGAQIMMNALDWIFQEIQMSKKYLIDDSFEPKTGAMANKYLGLMVLGLFVIGLFFHDAYFGMFYISSMILRPNNNDGLSKRYPISIYSFNPLHVYNTIHQFMQKQLKVMDDAKMKNSLDGRKVANYNQSDEISSILSSSSQNRRNLGNLDTISEDFA